MSTIRTVFRYVGVQSARQLRALVLGELNLNNLVRIVGRIIGVEPSQKEVQNGCFNSSRMSRVRHPITARCRRHAVIVDGERVLSCFTLAAACGGRHSEVTIEMASLRARNSTRCRPRFCAERPSRQSTGMVPAV